MTKQEYENKIKELQDELEQLKAVKIEAEQPKRWKPEQNETYWYLNGGVYCDRWTDCVNDNFQYIIGNCFKTEKEAKEHKKQIEYTARYKNYIEEHSEPIDWEDAYSPKCYAIFACDENKIEVGRNHTWKNQGVIYASSEQIIRDAIKEIGEDNFKKYVLGVK